MEVHCSRRSGAAYTSNSSFFVFGILQVRRMLESCMIGPRLRIPLGVHQYLFCRRKCLDNKSSPNVFLVFTFQICIQQKHHKMQVRMLVQFSNCGFPWCLISLQDCSWSAILSLSSIYCTLSTMFYSCAGDLKIGLSKLPALPLDVIGLKPPHPGHQLGSLTDL